MATAKLILDKRKSNPLLIDKSANVDNNKYPLRIRIFSGKKFAHISLQYKFRSSEWIETENRVLKSYPNSGRVNSGIQKRYSIVTTTLMDRAKTIKEMDISSVKRFLEAEIEKQLNDNENVSQDIISEFSIQTSFIRLEKFGLKLIERAQVRQEHATARWYKNGIDAIKQFNDDKDIALNNITVSFLERFSSEHISRGNSKNTISAYLRAVRAITNYAVKEELKGKRFDNYPWGIGGFSIPSQATKKRAIKKNLIEDIRNLNLEKDSELWNAQNYFIWMFNNRGMNFIDIAKLKRKQITETVFKKKLLVSGRNEYVRSKTDKDFSIKLTTDSIRILNLYNVFDKAPEDFVFPIGFEYSKKGWDEHCQKIKMNNERFKKLASLIGEKELKITTYVARHSWATIAKRSGISNAIIGEGLGHGDSKTTEIYLEEFEEDVLDDANDLIVS